MESVTVAKQCNPNLDIKAMIKAERSKLLTRGLFARVYYNGAQSLLFFSLVLGIGKLYDVELNDD